MSTASSSRSVLRRSCPFIPRIACPDCGQTVVVKTSGTNEHKGLVFHLHVLNLFKCWLKLGLTDIWNENKKFKKNQKKEKPAHIVFLCRILTIQVDKQGLYTFRRKIHVSNVIYLKLWRMKSRVKRRCFGFATWKIQKTSPKFHFEVTKKDPGLVFHFHVLNLFKCWSNLDLTNIWNELQKFKKKEKPAHIVFLCHILTIQVDK